MALGIDFPRMEPLFDSQLTGFHCEVQASGTVTSVPCNILTVPPGPNFAKAPDMWPDRYFYCTIINVHKPVADYLVAFLFHLKRPVGNGLCMMTMDTSLTREDVAAFKQVLRLLEYRRSEIRSVGDGYALLFGQQVCKPLIHPKDLPLGDVQLKGGELTSRSADAVLDSVINVVQGQPKILEVFPTRGRFSRRAIQRCCHPTLVFSTDQSEKQRTALTKRLWREGTHERS